MTMTYDNIQEIITTFYDSSLINYDTSYTTEDELKPDIIINHNSSKYIIDIIVFD